VEGEAQIGGGVGAQGQEFAHAVRTPGVAEAELADLRPAPGTPCLGTSVKLNT
jgi:hypothetical protein